MFFVLRKLSAAAESRNPMLGIVRTLVTGHNGPTRALATPSVEAQEALYRKLLDSAGLAASNVSLLEGEYATPSFHSLSQCVITSTWDGDTPRGRNRSGSDPKGLWRCLKEKPTLVIFVENRLRTLSSRIGFCGYV